MNINGYILCDVSIGDGDIQILDAEIDTAYQNSGDDGGLMESADFGFEFRDNFAPIGISSGDSSDSSATDETISLVEFLSDILNKLIANADDFSETDNSDLETQSYDAEVSAARVDDEVHKK